MKLIIAGSRRLNCTTQVVDLAFSKSPLPVPTEVVSSGAYGVDIRGEEWAKIMGIPVKVFPADFKKYGKAGGPIRNAQMAKYADALLAIWDGKSRGTRNMITEMRKLNKPVFVFEWDA